MFFGIKAKVDVFGAISCLLVGCLIARNDAEIADRRRINCHVLEVLDVEQILQDVVRVDSIHRPEIFGLASWRFVFIVLFGLFGEKINVLTVIQRMFKYVKIHLERLGLFDVVDLSYRPMLAA